MCVLLFSRARTCGTSQDRVSPSSGPPIATPSCPPASASRPVSCAKGRVAVALVLTHQRGEIDSRTGPHPPAPATPLTYIAFWWRPTSEFWRMRSECYRADYRRPSMPPRRHLWVQPATLFKTVTLCCARADACVIARPRSSDTVNDSIVTLSRRRSDPAQLALPSTETQSSRWIISATVHPTLTGLPHRVPPPHRPHSPTVQPGLRHHPPVTSV